MIARLTGIVRKLLGDRRVRYVLTGGTSAVVYYAVFTAGWLLLDERIPYLVLAVIANLVTSVGMYPVYRVAVFQSDVGWLLGFWKFYVIAFWSLISALVILPLLIELWHIPVLVSVLIVLVVQPLLNYQLMRLWAFRRRGSERLANLDDEPARDDRGGRVPDEQQVEELERG